MTAALSLLHASYRGSNLQEGIVSKEHCDWFENEQSMISLLYAACPEKRVSWFTSIRSVLHSVRGRHGYKVEWKGCAGI